MNASVYGAYPGQSCGTADNTLDSENPGGLCYLRMNRRAWQCWEWVISGASLQPA
jgi:hypothetical protein